MTLENFQNLIKQGAHWFRNHKLILVFCYLVIFSLIIYFLYYKNQEIKSQYKEYPSLDEYNNKLIKGTVSKIKKYYRGSKFVDLSNGTRFDLFGVHINYLYDKHDLYYFLQVKDSVYKDTNSDTLFIYRDDKKYYFKIGKAINEEYK